jgi:hypothetical protein
MLEFQQFGFPKTYMHFRTTITSNSTHDTVRVAVRKTSSLPEKRVHVKETDWYDDQPQR